MHYIYLQYHTLYVLHMPNVITKEKFHSTFNTVQELVLGYRDYESY